MSEPTRCPNCQSLLVHDIVEVYTRCLSCGWYAFRQSQIKGFVGPEFQDKNDHSPIRLLLDGLEASGDGRGYGKPHDEVRRLLEAAPVALSAMEKALDYIGGDDGECPICGGNEDAEPNQEISVRVPYHKSCPCKLLRMALKLIKEGSSDGSSD